MKMPFQIVVVSLVFICLAGASFAQTKKNSRATAPVPAATATPVPTPDVKVDEPSKRNGRPETGTAEIAARRATSAAPTHFYEFTRPGFPYGRIVIEHDEAGKGTISFLKDGNDELVTDPISLSAVTIEKINAALTDLKFLDSTDNYQYVRDYSHLGNITFRLKRDGRERTTKFNWTDNVGARALMNEYRKIGNEYTWRFEMLVSRENQKLLTPGLMDLLDSYIGRNEISDPKNLVPFLTELSTDERLPLMARNRATKIIKQVEKAKK